MTVTLALVGAGPTGLYTLHELSQHAVDVAITVFEAGSVAGVGWPFDPEINSVQLLSNIASSEIPPIGTAFADWLRQRPDYQLRSLGVDPDRISDVTYYPRVALGAYFRQKFDETVAALRVTRPVEVHTNLTVTDVVPRADGRWDVVVGDRRGDVFGSETFDIVVLATGHEFEAEPAHQGVRLIGADKVLDELDDIDPRQIGVIGSSLTAIDATVSVATRYGTFTDDDTVFVKADPDQPLHVTMMSRTGLLPEADFYYELPYPPGAVFTEARVQAEIERGADGLLNRMFELLVEEMRATTPQYLSRYDLATLDADTFAAQHLAERRQIDPFLWARLNLAEATINHADERSVEWRYLLLRCHELFGLAVPHMTPEDTERFHRGIRTVFVDNYASVPLRSVRRMLALHDAGVLDLLALGDDYILRPGDGELAGRVEAGDTGRDLSAIIDARGQTARPLSAFPFPSLRAALLAHHRADAAISVDEHARPLRPGLPNLYVWAIPYLLEERPFIQGLTACRDIAARIVEAIAASLLDSDSDEPAVAAAPAGTHAITSSPGAIALAGDVDVAAVDELQAALLATPGDVEIDMSKVTSLDASILRVLLTDRAAREEAGHTFTIGDASDDVVALLQVTDIGPELGLAPT